ncbi:MAG: hypothetical protein ACTSYS_13875 [Promethearchaeota archaeon]
MNKIAKYIWYVLAIFITAFIYVNIRYYIGEDIDLGNGVMWNWSDFFLMLISPTIVFTVLILLINDKNRKGKRR